MKRFYFDSATPFCTAVLKPGFHLSFAKVQSLCEWSSLTGRQVSICCKSFFEQMTLSVSETDLTTFAIARRRGRRRRQRWGSSSNSKRRRRRLMMSMKNFRMIKQHRLSEVAAVKTVSGRLNNRWTLNIYDNKKKKKEKIVNWCDIITIEGGLLEEEEEEESAFKCW